MKKDYPYFLLTDAWYIPVTDRKLDFDREIVGDEIIYTFIYGCKRLGEHSPYSFLEITTI